jgi:hypothetical protein
MVLGRLANALKSLGSFALGKGLDRPEEGND